MRQTVNRGSKNEHEAAVLITGSEKRYELRIRGANPFEIHPKVEALIGHNLCLNGTPEGPVLYVDL